MTHSIGTNIASLKAQRSLAKATESVTSTFERLSSGFRINKASDDAAGLAVSTSLNTDVRIFTQGIRNINDGVSMLGIASSGLSQLSGVIQRQLELSEQAANGSYSSVQRKSLNQEAQALRKEFNRIVSSMSFNDITLMNGSLSSGTRIQAGYGIEGSISVTLGSYLARLAGSGATSSSFTHSNSPAFSQENELIDLNGDGKLDLVSAANSNGVSVSFGNGDGTFQANATYQTFHYGINAGNISLGDVNGDGITDVIATDMNDSNPGRFAVLIGNANGTFQAAVSYTQGATYRTGDTELADINGDGIFDYVQSDFANGVVKIFQGNGDGSFKAAVSLATGSTQTSELLIRDFNNDGKLDIVALHAGGNTQGITSLLGNGDGTFKSGIYNSNFTGDEAGIAADFNNDGILDLISTEYTPGNLFIRFGNGDGSFKANTTIANILGGWGNKYIVDDFNNDGIKDFAVQNGQQNTGYIFLGNTNSNGDANGTFTQSSTFSFTNNGGHIISGDLNGDGISEILVNQNGAGTIRIFSQQTSNVQTLDPFSLESQSDARNALGILSNALTRISSEIGNIGASMSRLNIASQVLATSREAYSGASSRIQDIDVAAEATSLVANQIKQKIGGQVLASANLQPQLLLQLLS